MQSAINVSDTISEIKSTDITSVQESQTLNDIITQMVANKISKIFVKNGQHPVGVVSDKDIIRFLYIDRSKRGIEEIFASELMNSICFAVDSMTCKQAAQMMMMNRISSLGIGSKEKLEGIITKSDLINYYVATDAGKTKVSDYMTISYFAAPHHSKIHDILKKMITCDISRVVITQNEQPIGIITNGDIFRASLATNKMRIVQESTSDDWLWSETGFVGSQPAAEIMTEGLITVQADSLMKNAAKLLLDKKIDSIGVKVNDEMIGILNKANALYALVDSK
ncbi:MAG: CBS domain-containing protein [Candidatus Nitrosotenuis sp.]